MTIREAGPADLADILALERASFPTDAWSEAMMHEELASPHGWYILDEEAGRLVGYAGLRAPKGAHDADVQTIAIAGAARGRGRGRALLIRLLAEADRRRVRDVFLEVRADNPIAQALYASEGFVEVGLRPRYYQPDDVDAVVMRLDVPAWRHARGPGTGAAPTTTAVGADAVAAQASAATATATGTAAAAAAADGIQPSVNAANVGRVGRKGPTDGDISDTSAPDAVRGGEAGACT